MKNNLLIFDKEWILLIDNLTEDLKKEFWRLWVNYDGINYCPLIKDIVLKNVFDRILIEMKEHELKQLDKHKEKIDAVIMFLNKATQKKFNEKNTKTRSLIRSLIEKGYTGEEFKYVINAKCSSWLNTDMEKYLRPETLFSTIKFDGYVNERDIKKGVVSVEDNKKKKIDNFIARL